jgi:hypothetical protein
MEGATPVNGQLFEGSHSSTRARETSMRVSPHDCFIGKEYTRRRSGALLAQRQVAIATRC